MTSIIQIASSTPTNLFAYVGQLWVDLWLLLAIFAGIPFGFYVIRKIIKIVPKDKDVDKETPEDRADKATIKYLKRLREIDHY